MTIPAMTCLAASVFAALSIPVLLLAQADHLTPAWLRATPAAATRTLRAMPLTVAALLMLLGGNPMPDDQTPDEEPLDPAEQAMAEDGFTSLARYLGQHPMPRQQDRRHAA